MSSPSKQFIRFGEEHELLDELLHDCAVRQATCTALLKVEFTQSLCDLVWLCVQHSLDWKMTTFKNAQIRADIQDAAEPLEFKQNTRGYRAIQDNAELYAINFSTLKLSRYRNHWTEHVLFVNSDPVDVSWEWMSGDEYEDMQLGIKCCHRAHLHLCGEWIWIDNVLWLSIAPFAEQYGMFKYKEIVQQRNGEWQRWLEPAQEIHPTI